MKNWRWPRIVGLSCLTFVVGCGGQTLSLGSQTSAVEVGTEIYGIAIESAGAEGKCIVSSDGQPTEKDVKLEACPSGSLWLTRKSWTMKAVEQIDGDYYWWTLRNTSSGYCIKWVNSSTYVEAECNEEDSSFKFTFSDDHDLSAVTIDPKAASNDCMRQYRETVVINAPKSYTPTDDITWSLYGQ